MTKKEELLKVLQGIPDELVDNAYSLDLGKNGLSIVLGFDTAYLQKYPPGQIKTDSNGYLGFSIYAGGKTVRVIMT
jgi:hypothetical protein